jgi:hypothetical protein
MEEVLVEAVVEDLVGDSLVVPEENVSVQTVDIQNYIS